MKKKIKILNSEDGYNQAAEFYDAKEKYLNSFEQDKLIPLLRDVEDKKVLDIGAGTGRLTMMLAKLGAEVTAVDVSKKMLEALNKKCVQAKLRVTTILGNAEKLAFENKTFNVVIAAFLIVHLKDLRKFFDEAYRVLKDGGTFVVTNINQKDPPLVKIKNGDILIESFYHRPEKIREILKSLAFGIAEEIFVKEKEVWVNQIVVAKK